MYAERCAFKAMEPNVREFYFSHQSTLLFLLTFQWYRQQQSVSCSATFTLLLPPPLLSCYRSIQCGFRFLCRFSCRRNPPQSTIPTLLPSLVSQHRYVLSFPMLEIICWDLVWVIYFWSIYPIYFSTTSYVMYYLFIMFTAINFMIWSQFDFSVASLVL